MQGRYRAELQQQAAQAAYTWACMVVPAQAAGVSPSAFCLLPFAFCLLPYFEAGRSINTVSSVNFFSSVPVGTRNENVHENDGVAPTSAKDCAVL